ncbi:MAG: CoA-binding protein [Chloroflexi bacterium]|nr:CoA-binding protein [Chloroflexota bacterium]
MGNEWARNLVDDDATIREILRTCRRIAVLGIKTEAQAGQPAIEVPRYLIAQGYDVVPVPVYYPEVARILGRPVYRRVQDIPGGVDLVDVFRRPQDIPPHLDDLLAARPRVVWFQLGIRHDDAARTLAAAGIQVVQDRCTLIEHRRLLGHPLDR